MRKIVLIWLTALFACLSIPPALHAGEDAAALIAALASTKTDERADAIAALQKMGDAATRPLMKAEAEEQLGPRQLLLVRRILGDRWTEATPLKPVELSKLTPFGEIKAKGIAGDPNLLLNKDSKLIVMNGEFVLEMGLLEYLVVVKHPNAKTHETVAAVYASPRDISYALLACEYTFADGTNTLPREAGILISIEYEWEPVNAAMGDALAEGTEVPPPNGNNPEKSRPAKKWIRVPIEYFVWNTQTEKIMKRSPFAFTGSKFERGENGKMDFMADIEKSIVALMNDPYALMNTLLDMKNVNPRHAAGYAINRYTIPQRGTKCRVVFEPWSGKTLTAEDLKDSAESKSEEPAPAPTPASPPQK